MNKVVTVAVVVLLATLALSAYAYTVYLPGLSNSSSQSNSNTSSGTTSTNGLGGPGTASLNIYLTDKPPSNTTMKYLLVNVTSVTLRYEGNSSGSQTSTTSTSSTGSSTSSTTTSTTSTTGTSEQTESQFTYNVSSSIGTNLNLTRLQGNKILLGASKIPSGNVTGIVFHITGAIAFYNDSTSKQLKVVADGKLMIPVAFTVQSNGTVDLTIDITPNSIHTSQGQASVLTPVIHVAAVSSGSHGTTTETSETSESETSSSSTSTSTTTTTTTSSST